MCLSSQRRSRGCCQRSSKMFCMLWSFNKHRRNKRSSVFHHANYKISKLLYVIAFSRTKSNFVTESSQLRPKLCQSFGAFFPTNIVLEVMRCVQLKISHALSSGPFALSKCLHFILDAIYLLLAH